MSRVTLAAIVFAANLSAQAADDRYPFVRDGKLGFIDASGTEVIPAQFQPIGDFAHFSEGLAPVDGPDGSGYIDPSGRFVIGPQRKWGQPRPFHNGIAVVLIWATDRSSLNSAALIDRTGRIIRRGPSVIETEYFHPSTRPQPGWTGGCSEGLCPVESNGLWAFADPKGTTIIPRQFTNADHFWHGLARVAWNDGYGYIDKTGRTVWRVRKQHLDRHVVLACLSGEEIEGDLVEVCDDDVSIDIDTESAHDMAGVLLFVSLAEIEAVP